MIAGGIGSVSSPTVREGSLILSLRCDVIVIDNVVLELPDVDIVEARLGEQLERLLFAPRCAQTFAAKRQQLAGDRNLF